MNKKKKLLYIVRYPIYEDFNLRGKFDGQLAAFRNLELDVYHLVFDREYFYLMHDGKAERISKATTRLPMYFHTKVYADMHRAVRKAADMVHFDYVYWRGAPTWPSSCKVARKLHAQGVKILYEIPTYVKGGEASMSLARKLFSLCSRPWKRKLMDYPDVFIFTGDADFDTFYGKPAVNIDNGINVNALPMRSPKYSSDTIHILALASMSYWHGYDRLIRSLYEYTGEQKIVLHMVGGNDGGMLPEWKKLTEALQVEDRVLFHGKLYGAELSEMFDLCDVGINSLALFRKKMAATSELKIREYTARGLPFVCSVDDPALQFAGEPFWIKVSNDESIPDMQQIVDFANTMRADREHPKKLRAYAQQYMSWEGQYAPLMKMFTEE